MNSRVILVLLTIGLIITGMASWFHLSQEEDAEPAALGPLGLENGKLIYSDRINLGIYDIDTGTTRIVKSRKNDDGYMEFLAYDGIHNRIVSSLSDLDGAPEGLMYCDDNGLVKDKIGNFIPIGLYQYNDYYVMNSAQVVRADSMEGTRIGVYDSGSRTLVKDFNVPGVVQCIAGYKNTAWFCSFDGAHREHSNIFVFDMESMECRKLLPRDQGYVPFALEYSYGFLYGIYRCGLNIPEEAPQNLLVKIDPQSGQETARVSLPAKALNIAISSDGKYAYITHCDKYKKLVIDTPLSRVDLVSLEVQTYQGNYRAYSIIERQGKLYIGDDKSSHITVIDCATMQVEDTIEVEFGAAYLVDPRPGSPAES